MAGKKKKVKDDAPATATTPSPKPTPAVPWGLIGGASVAAILAIGAVVYLNKVPHPTTPPTSMPLSDPCTEMNKRLEDLHQQKSDQTRKLVGLLGDGGLEVVGSDTVEDTFRTTYQQFGEGTEACRLLNIGIQCADKRQPGGALSLKLADALPAICGRATSATTSTSTTSASASRERVLPPVKCEKCRNIDQKPAYMTKTEPQNEAPSSCGPGCASCVSYNCN